MEASTNSISSRARGTANRVTAKLFATVAGLLGLALMLGGGAAIAGHAFERDDGGYVNSDRQKLESTAYAITSDDIDLGVGELDWAPDGILGEVRVQVASDSPVFVGHLSQALVELGDLALELGDPPAVVEEVAVGHRASVANRG
jgi:hypothetical protein